MDDVSSVVGEHAELPRALVVGEVVVVDVERLVAGHDISLPVKRPRTRLLLEAAIGQQRVVAGISPGEEGLGQVGRCAAGGAG